MKLDKTAVKELEKAIKQKAKAYGYKGINGWIFAKIGDCFADSVSVVVNRTKLTHRIKIKKLSYDDLFWDIMNMSDNKLQPLSLRANGAFKAPGITISEDEIELDENVEDIADTYCSVVASTVKSFLDNNSVGEYVLTKVSSPYAPVLRCLEYLDRGDTASALEIANSEISMGNCGGFSNEGKNFFEWVVHYCSYKQSLI